MTKIEKQDNAGHAGQKLKNMTMQDMQDKN